VSSELAVRAPCSICQRPPSPPHEPGVDETVPPPLFAADDWAQRQPPAWMSPPRRAVSAPSSLKLGVGRGRWRVEAEQGSRRRRPGSGATSRGLRRRPGSRHPGSGPSSSSLSRAVLSSHGLRVLHRQPPRAPPTAAACSFDGCGVLLEPSVLLLQIVGGEAGAREWREARQGREWAPRREEWQ
jgi:hypothetical protein